MGMRQGAQIEPRRYPDESHPGTGASWLRITGRAGVLAAVGCAMVNTIYSACTVFHRRPRQIYRRTIPQLHIAKSYSVRGANMYIKPRRTIDRAAVAKSLMELELLFGKKSQNSKEYAPFVRGAIQAAKPTKEKYER